MTGWLSAQHYFKMYITDVSNRVLRPCSASFGGVFGQTLLSVKGVGSNLFATKAKRKIIQCLYIIKIILNLPGDFNVESLPSFFVGDILRNVLKSNFHLVMYLLFDIIFRCPPPSGRRHTTTETRCRERSRCPWSQATNHAHSETCGQSLLTPLCACALFPRGRDSKPKQRTWQNSEDGYLFLFGVTFTQLC